jgi:hypothetical protein
MPWFTMTVTCVRSGTARRTAAALTPEAVCRSRSPAAR